MEQEYHKNKPSEIEVLKTSISDITHSVANWRFKYFLWLVLMFLNEYNMEFSKLSQEDEKTIIENSIAENGGNFDKEKSRFEVKSKLNEMTRNLDRLDFNDDDQTLLTEQINSLSDFLKTTDSKGYEIGLQEIRSYKWFQWDLYYITDSFLMLLLFIMLAYDGNRYYYFGDLDTPFMFGLVRYAFKATVLWSIYDFGSNIFTRSERILKSEILISVVSLYVLFIITAIWEDVKREFIKKHPVS